MSRALGFCLGLVLALGGSTFGRDAAAAEPPEAKSAAGAAQDGDVAQGGGAKPPAGSAPDAQPPLRQEHVIYLPYEKLRDVFEKEDSSIVLPYGQFLEMWNRLVRPERPPIQPPASGVITRADYKGAVSGQLARLEATLDLESLSDEWARLPLQFGDAAIASARAEDGDVLLGGAGQGRYELLVRGKGKHRITLGLVVGVKSAAEGRSFSVECPTVGVSNLELEIPEKDLAIEVAPRRTSELQTEKDATRLRAALGATDRFTVSWQPKSGGLDEAGGLADVTGTIAVDVGDGVVHTHAVFDYQVLRGSLGELVVDVPLDQRLLDVQAAGLRDWRTETAGEHQRITVRLHAPATGSVRLELHTETPLSKEAFQVGQVRAVGAARESGILAVRGAEDVGLEYPLRESLTRIDAAEAPEALRKPRSTFYKFFTPDHKLLVAASPLEPRIAADTRVSILVDKTRLTARGEFRYQVTRSGIFTLAFRLPAGFQVDDVRTESMERFEVASAEGGQTLTVYLGKRLLGDLAATVTVSQAREKPAGELDLPVLEPLGATREQGLVAVIAPESLEVKTNPARLQAARAATPAELAAKGFQPEIPQGSVLAAAFSFVTRPVSIVQTIAERPRRTSAAVGTVANVKEDVVQVTTTFRYLVEFAGADRFRIAVPAGVSDRLQVEGEGIKERLAGEKPTGQETVEWTIVLHSETLGQCTFTATYDQKISISDPGPQFILRPIQALDVDREAGEIAIYKDRALSVDPVPAGLEEIDPRELSQPLGAGQPYLTYRYFGHPAQLALGVTKHERQDVVETVVRRAYIEAVVTEDGPITIRARYDLKSSERQRLAVALRDPRILGISVAGQSVTPEKAPESPGGGPGDKTYLINVARADDSDEPFQIAIVFETPLPEEQLDLTGLLRLPLPRFDEGVKFQQVYVRVWVPKDFRLVGDPEGFASHISVGLWDARMITRAPDNPDAWFPKDASSFDFQVGGTQYLFSSLTGPAELKIGYWHIPTMTVIASLVVLVIGGVLVPFSLDAKVFTILAAALGLLLAGLFLPSLVHSWLLAARLGIAAVVALWLVVWLLFVRRTRMRQS